MFTAIAIHDIYAHTHLSVNVLECRWHLRILLRNGCFVTPADHLISNRNHGCILAVVYFIKPDKD